MGPRIAVIGAGAVGGYVGGHLARSGQDVTLVDPWPDHVEAMRAQGLELEGVTPEESCTEIEFMNGAIVEQGLRVGRPAPAHQAMVEAVKRVERGELAPSPDVVRGLLSGMAITHA